LLLLVGLSLTGCGDFDFSSSPHQSTETRWEVGPTGLTVAPFLGKPLIVNGSTWNWTGTNATTTPLILSGCSIALLDQRGVAVPGTTTAVTASTLAFIPSSPLQPGVTYRASLANSPSGPVSWTFVPWWPAELDPGFARATLPAADTVAALAVQPGQGALVSGTRQGWTGGVVAKFGEEGLLDPSFGVAGVAGLRDLLPGELLPGVTGASDGASGLAVDPSGRILVAGTWSDTGGQPSYTGKYGWFTVRLDGHGVLDPTFAAGGFFSEAVAWAPPAPTRVEIQADGKLVVGFDQPWVERLGATGALDSGFATGGHLQPSGRLVGMRPLADGSLMVASSSSVCSAQVDRYGPTGAPDASFGSNGAVCLAGLDFAQGVAFDEAGGMSAVGHVYMTGGPRGATLRYLADGQPDPAYGVGGVSFLPAPTDSALLATSNGRMAVAQTIPWGARSLHWLGPTGAVERRLELPADLVVRALQFDPSGRLYLLASWSPPGTYLPSWNFSSGDLLLLRFLP